MRKPRRDLEALQELMIKAVVLDFDGVVVDSNALKYRAFFELFPPDGGIAGVISGVVSRLRLATRFEILREILLGLGKSDDEVEALVPSYAAQYNARVQRGILAIGVSAEVRTTLSLLGDRYHLYINSGTYAPALSESVANLGISQFFQRVYGRPPSKRDNLADIVASEEALGPEVVVVGDGEEDYECATALNCHFIGISNAFNNWQGSGFPLIPTVTRSPELIASLDARSWQP